MCLPLVVAGGRPDTSNGMKEPGPFGESVSAVTACSIVGRVTGVPSLAVQFRAVRFGQSSVAFTEQSSCQTFYFPSDPPFCLRRCAARCMTSTCSCCPLSFVIRPLDPLRPFCCTVNNPRRSFTQLPLCCTKSVRVGNVVKYRSNQ